MDGRSTKVEVGHLKDDVVLEPGGGTEEQM